MILSWLTQCGFHPSNFKNTGYFPVRQLTHTHPHRNDMGNQYNWARHPTKENVKKALIQRGFTTLLVRQLETRYDLVDRSSEFFAYVKEHPMKNWTALYSTGSGMVIFGFSNETDAVRAGLFL